jgi:hypothetical protein
VQVSPGGSSRAQRIVSAKNPFAGEAIHPLVQQQLTAWCSQLLLQIGSQTALAWM